MKKSESFLGNQIHLKPIYIYNSIHQLKEILQIKPNN